MSFPRCAPNREMDRKSDPAEPFMQDAGYELRRIPLLRRWVNKGCLLDRWRPSLWCGGETVPAHHFADRREVGGAALRRPQHGSHITEVPGAEDTGAYDRQHPSVDLIIVVEAVDDSA